MILTFISRSGSHNRLATFEKDFVLKTVDFESFTTIAVSRFRSRHELDNLHYLKETLYQSFQPCFGFQKVDLMSRKVGLTFFVFQTKLKKTYDRPMNFETFRKPMKRFEKKIILILKYFDSNWLS